MDEISTDLRRLGEKIRFHMVELQKLFEPGVHLSLVIRDPVQGEEYGKQGSGFFSGDPGGYDAVIKTLEDLKRDQKRREATFNDSSLDRPGKGN